MRLRDLNGQFVYEVDAKGYRRSDGESLEGMQGLLFQCPKSGEGLDRGHENGRGFIRGAHHILVLFANPRNAAPPPANAHLRSDGTPNPRWTIENGTTLDDLTLSPSVDCDIPWKDASGVLHPSDCKFHGFVRNGDAS